MDKLIDFRSYPVKMALKVLLQDKSTKKNIIWATEPPERVGKEKRDTKILYEVICEDSPEQYHLS